MQTSTAINSVVDFFEQYPPFSFISKEDLAELAAHIRLAFFAKDETLFEEQTIPKPCFYIVKRGRVTLLQKYQEDSQVLIDECGTGDIIGVRALFAADTYLSTAKVAEDSLVFIFPTQKAQAILEKYPKVSLYFATVFAYGMSPAENDKRKARKFLAQKEDWTTNTVGIDTIQIEPQKEIITATRQESIQEVASWMSKYRIGSMIIVEENTKKPLGIVTDTDLRSKVVAKGIAVQTPIGDIMSSPVLTIPSGLSLLEVMLLMSAKRVSHLCITKDGTDQSEVIGIVSQRDVLLLQGNNPSILAKQIRKSNNIERIAGWRDQAEKLVRSYLYQELAIPLISNVITEINDTLIEKAIELSIRKLEQEGKTKPNLSFCWLSLGSEGRKEQFLRTDQDNAFIYQDVEDVEEAKRVKDYFLSLSSSVTDLLVQWGFVECPADMMASNPKWCQPVATWEKYFQDWIEFSDEKAIMHTTIFFDFRPIYGDVRLADELKKFIFTQIDKRPKFLSLLAKNALQNLPPLSFFNNMIVEKNGEYKDLFDIKARAMMPLADIARVLMLEFGWKGYGSTFERFEAVGNLSANLKDICESAALAYEIFVKHRAISGFKHKNSGRYINPKELNKLEKQILKTSFETIAKLQKIAEVRYQLNYIR